uniref:Alpha/beta hydrolase n=1 Tax=Pyricularia oryzae (strain P131) TaxID=1143193 RepID=L7JBB6_PYRO1
MRGGEYFAAGNGTDIYYSSEGAGGIPMLLIHGWTCDQNDWAFQIPFLLSLGIWVIAMDLRGHGHSAVSDALLRAAGPEGAALATTDFWDAVGLLSEDAPVWVRPWQQRRTWAVEGRVVMDTFLQLGDHLGPSGVEYLRRTRGRGEGRVIPRFVTCAVDSSVEMEREAGLDARVDRVEVVPGGHFHHVVSPDKFNALLKEWLTEREWIK